MLWINEFVIPFFAIYEFILFVGWLKVAQVGELVNVVVIPR